MGSVLTRRQIINGAAVAVAGYALANQASFAQELSLRASGIMRAAPSGRWATGGTAAMRASSSYPDPFSIVDEVCTLTCQQTQGPCWAPRAPVRQDVSEGEAGIPMRTALRLVDADTCSPLPGAEVEIWHCNIDGVYSANDVEGGDFCTNGNEHALSGYFFRGRAVSDSRGIVVFDGCYPGWYSGRAVHVHLLARPMANTGESHTRNAMTTTQLYFSEALTEEIFDTVEGYRDMGQPDTRLANDNVLRGLDDVSPYLFGIEQMTDGAMLAWKTIAISSSQSCGSSDQGGGGPGAGPGRGRRGFPPGGPGSNPGGPPFGTRF